MKRLLTFVLTLTLALTAVGCSGKKPPSDTESKSAQTTTAPLPDIPESPASDFQYEVSGDGITITGYTGTFTEVIVPDTIDGKTVTAIGNGAFSENQKIVSVTMPNTVTSLGDEAFMECSMLTSVSLSDHLESIGNSCFMKSAISSVKFTENLTSVGDFAFDSCWWLKTVRIPKSLKTWGIGIFGASGLESIELEDGLEAVGPGAFYGTPITQVRIPDSVREIGDNAFTLCADLKSVSIGNGVQIIGDGAFILAESLEEIVLPASLTKIGDLAFSACSGLKMLKFEGNAPEFNVEGEQYTSYTVCYHEGAEGFTSPEWNGHPVEIW